MEIDPVAAIAAPEDSPATDLIALDDALKQFEAQDPSEPKS